MSTTLRSDRTVPMARPLPLPVGSESCPQDAAMQALSEALRRHLASDAYREWVHAQSAGDERSLSDPCEARAA